jgi:hypothetical protein
MKFHENFGKSLLDLVTLRDFFGKNHDFAQLFQQIVVNLDIIQISILCTKV